jgi:hypothetical protein
MASFLDNLFVSTSDYKNKVAHPVSSNTITTQTFFRLKPVYFQVMKEDSTLKVTSSSYLLLQPQIKPIFGSVREVFRAFYVPFISVWKGYHDFYTRTPHQLHVNYDTPSSVLYETCLSFSTHSYLEILTSADYSTEVTANDSYDFKQGFLAGMKYFKFNNSGRFIYDIMNSLGYKLICSDQPVTPISMPHYSALKILCFARCWYDHYRNKAYENDLSLKAIFNREYDDANPMLSTNDLKAIFRSIYDVQFDSDYFTSAWDTPTAPNDTSSSIPSVNIKDITTDSDTVVDNSNDFGTPVLGDVSLHEVRSLSSYLLTAEKAATDFLKRMQLVGTDILDRLQSMSGLRNTYESLNRSRFISSYDLNVQFGQVIAQDANVDTNQPLGDFAGRGEASNSNTPWSFEIESKDERGLALVLTYIEPKTAYYQGIDRFNIDLDPLEHYQGDFDSLGTQAISSAEVFANFDHFSNNDLNPLGFFNNIFGFTSRYGHLKVGHDILGGDFARPLWRDSMKSWHLFRDYKFVVNDEYPVHDMNFTTGDMQFNRVFHTTDDSIDNFNNVIFFNATLYSDMLPFHETYQFMDEDKKKKVKMFVNGSKTSE